MWCAFGHGTPVRTQGPDGVRSEKWWVSPPEFSAFLAHGLMLSKQQVSRNPKPKTRNPKLEIQNPKPETWIPKPEILTPQTQTAGRRGGAENGCGGCRV